MPYLNVNPLLSHRHPAQRLVLPNAPEEIDRLLFWRYYQAMNKNSARLILSRLPDGPVKNECQKAFDKRFTK